MAQASNAPTVQAWPRSGQTPSPWRGRPYVYDKEIQKFRAEWWQTRLGTGPEGETEALRAATSSVTTVQRRKDDEAYAIEHEIDTKRQRIAMLQQEIRTAQLGRYSARRREALLSAEITRHFQLIREAGMS